jgi:D-ribose pyranase
MDDIPRVLDVLAAIRKNFHIGNAVMAEEFQTDGCPQTTFDFKYGLDEISVLFEPHAELKKRVPNAIGLIRTGDSTPYANLILESA